MENLITITINNNKYNVRANSSVLQACEKVGIEIPRFCYHEKLSVAGNCRMCLVEVQKAPKPVVSCAMPVSKGMVIFTETPLVKKAREAVLEFLLINHPLDCPICDQGGECDLQDETLTYGSDRGRFFEFKRSVEDKECGPIVKTIMTRCIHCTRCIRFSSEIAGIETLGAFGRGKETEIGTYVQNFIKTELSGNLVDLCPVGALTSKPYAFRARSWELNKIETVDFFDGVCSDIVVQTRNLITDNFNKNEKVFSAKEEIVRILPNTNSVYEENWISDKTRYAFDGLKNQRVLHPLINNRKNIKSVSTWKDALLFVAKTLESGLYDFYQRDLKPSKNGVVLGSMLDVQGLYFVTQFMKFYGTSDIQLENFNTTLNKDVPFFSNLNRTVSSFQDLKFLLVVGSNIRFEASVLNTFLRKIQSRNNFTYVTVGAYSSLRMKQNHISNGLRGTFSLVESRDSKVSSMVNTKMPSIILGAEILKIKGGYVLQNMVRFLAKKFYAKNKNSERFGVLHSNVSSLAATFLGVQPGVRSSLYVPEAKDKKFNNLFVIQQNNVNTKQWLSNSQYTNVISLGTHKINNVVADINLPIKSLYEKDGMLFNIEGRLRNFYKTVTAPAQVKTFEIFFWLIVSVHPWWNLFFQTLWNFEKVVNTKKLLNNVAAPFNLNFFLIKENAKVTPLYMYQPTVTNFYLNDMISSNSTVMGECSLFLKKKSNFNV